MLKIRNSKSKEEKEVTEEQWQSIDKNPLITGWFVVPAAKKPKELEAFEAAKKPVTTETAKPETPKNTGTNGKDK